MTKLQRRVYRNVIRAKVGNDGLRFVWSKLMDEVKFCKDTKRRFDIKKFFKDNGIKHNMAPYAKPKKKRIFGGRR